MAAGALNDRERVLDATDLAAVVGDHVNLRAKGRELIGLCPFHDDSRPSMYVVPHKQIFHCFACGAGGNAIDFMMKFHGMDFRAALEQLALRAGIELTRSAPRRDGAGKAAGAQVSRDDLARANALAMRFFRGILAHQQHGQSARAMLDRRGIGEATRLAFAIGAAPDRWDGLLAMAHKEGIAPELLAAAGLVRTRDTGGYYDTFRNRLMFPILDQLGRPIAFGGRILADGTEDAKYMNSPESELFDKSSTLYGLKQAMLGIKKADRAVVCEGYMDVIACHQAGVDNAVATLGTAFTPSHARVLRRICSSVVLVFDGDEAGQKAAERAIDVCFAEPIDVRVAVIPDGQDPDDLLRSPGGREAFDALIESATDAIEFRYARLDASLSGNTAGSAARTTAVEQDIARLAQVGLSRVSPLRREAVIERLARVAGVPRAAIVEAIGQAGTKPGRRAPQDEAGPARTDIDVSSMSPAAAALACLLAEPSLSECDPAGVDTVLSSLSRSGGILATLAHAVNEAIEDRGASGVDRLPSTLDDAGARVAAASLITWAQRTTERESLGERWGERVTAMWNQCVARLRTQGADDADTAEPADAMGRIERIRARRASSELAIVPRVFASPGSRPAPASPVPRID